MYVGLIKPVGQLITSSFLPCHISCSTIFPWVILISMLSSAPLRKNTASSIRLPVCVCAKERECVRVFACACCVCVQRARERESERERERERESERERERARERGMCVCVCVCVCVCDTQTHAHKRYTFMCTIVADDAAPSIVFADANFDRKLALR